LKKLTIPIGRKRREKDEREDAKARRREGILSRRSRFPVFLFFASSCLRAFAFVSISPIVNWQSFCQLPAYQFAHAVQLPYHLSMRRFKVAGCAAFLLLAAVSTARSDDALDPFSMAEDPQIPKLISLLSDPDPSLRSDAVQKLIKLGDSAGPALRREIATAPPQVRCEIDLVLLHLPWLKPGDSDIMEKMFTGYADLDAESRCSSIDSWLGQYQNAAAPGFFRVLLNDPNPAVRWEAADALRLTLDDEPVMATQLLQRLDGNQPPHQDYLPPAENAPLLAAAGWGCRMIAPKRATALMEQARRMEQEHPSAFRGQLDFVFLWLVERANLVKDRGRVVSLFRQQAERTSWNDDRVPDAVTSLFAAQADYGPMPGFTQDLRSYQQYFTHPEMVYCLARLAQRQGKPVVADVLNDLAFLMSGTSADAHFMAGTFLSSHDWDQPAERELKWALNLSGGKAVNVYFQLAALADDRDDDLAAARYMETGLQKLPDPRELVQTNRFGQTSPWSSDAAWAEVHWHYLRAARDAGDAAEAKVHLDKLLAMDQDVQILHKDPGMAADIVPALQSLNRNEEADRIFDAAYHDLREKVLAAPDEPMPKNNLAWLCACSGKKLDEAVALAGEAVAADPENAACLDTQAEALMRSGQPGKALEIETRALAAKPDDVYMEKQIKRFAIAAKAKPAQ
jgi:tetratricopeptide (TPR) repeat protein